MSNEDHAAAAAKRYDQWFREQVRATLKCVREGSVALLSPEQVRENLRRRRKPDNS